MRGYILLPAILLLTISTTAQITYEGPADGSISSGITLNTNNFSEAPPSKEAFRIFNIFEPEESSSFINCGDSLNLPTKYYQLTDRIDNSLDSTILFKNFEGFPQNNIIPPDDYIAAGPSHLMMVINSEFRIFDKNGNVIKTIDADIWYASLLSGPVAIFDPKVMYDPLSSRWVMVWLTCGNIQGENYYLLSVSDDSDPTGIWFNWALPSDVNGSTAAGNWADYEGVGFDDSCIYLCSNQFSFTGFYNYVKLRIIDKTNVYINANPGTVTWKDIWSISAPGGGQELITFRPVRMESYSDSYYLVCMPASGNHLTWYKLNDALTNPVLTGQNIPTISYSSPPNSSQLGGIQKIEANGGTLKYEPIYKDGLIYLVHPIKNPNYTSLSSLHFLAFDPAVNSLEQEVVMGDDQHFYFFPALAIDKNKNIIFSYSRSSENEYAGGYYTILPDSALPTGSYALKEGNAYYFQDFGSGRNRWGDYSGAWIDPADSLSFWICSEYVEALNTWGTWVGGIIYDSEIPVELTSFDASVEGNNVALKWISATEINNFGYELLRNEKASPSWNSLAFVHGKGTTTEQQTYNFTDTKVECGNYVYRLVQIDFDGSRNIIAEIPVNIFPEIKDFALSQNYPNPFNPSTHIEYEIPSGLNSVHVKLAVFDILGNEVAVLVNEDKAPGSYDIEFSSKKLSSGTYIYKLTAGNYSSTRKMLVLR